MRRYLGSPDASLTAGLDEPTAATVTLDHIATRPIVPLNSLLKKQSVKGLETHLLVKGVAFNEGDDGIRRSHPSRCAPTSSMADSLRTKSPRRRQ